MLIGIIIGFILHEVVSYGKGLIAMKKQAKVMREKGQKVLIDYVNLRIHNLDDDKEKAYKRETIGFSYPKNGN